jgi:hypothetical protein
MSEEIPDYARRIEKSIDELHERPLSTNRLGLYILVGAGLVFTLSHESRFEYEIGRMNKQMENMNYEMEQLNEKLDENYLKINEGKSKTEGLEKTVEEVSCEF